jgi:ABC-type multidrug transport system ATPase subunit
LKDFIDTPVKRYSSGMYARLGFAIAAHLEPDILIIDEVLSVGDFMFQAKGLEKMRSVLSNGSTVIFVSHNMKAVADLCQRSIYLQQGRVVEDGPTSQVLSSYLKQATATSIQDRDVDVRIESVVVRGSSGERRDFESGDAVEVEVTIIGIRPAVNVACILNVFNESFWEVFNTSSERLGARSRDIAPGERRTFRFLLDLHLAPGTFHFGVFLYRYEISHVFDRVQPAATIVVTSEVDGQGIAQLNPRLA